MAIIPFKNRKLELDKVVKVYKNKYTNLCSIVQHGYVVAYADAVCLSNVDFKASRPCGHITGIIKDIPIPDKTALSFEIEYNPFQHFYFKHNQLPAKTKSNQLVVCDRKKGLYCFPF